MPVNAALTATEYAALVGGKHDCLYSLDYMPDTEIGHCTVDGTPGFPTVGINVKSASAGWTSAKADQTVKITNAAGTVLRGYFRLRLVPSSTLMSIEELSEGETGLFSSLSRITSIQDGDLATALERWDLAAKKPYNAGGISRQDYSIAVGSYNTTPPPIVNILINSLGGPLKFDSPSGAPIPVVAVASVLQWTPSVIGSATLTYLWTVPASWTSVSGTTTATLSAIAPPGKYWLYLTVTDSVGGATVAARPVIVGTSQSVGVLCNITSDQRDFQSRKLRVRMTTDRFSELPFCGLVMVSGPRLWNNVDVPSAAHGFAGFLDSNTFQHVPGYFEAQADLLGPGAVLDKIDGYAAELSYDGTTGVWERVAASLSNVPFRAWWLGQWHVANLWRCWNFTPFTTSNLAAQRRQFSFSANQSVYQQLRALADTYDANIGSRSSGEFILALHPAFRKVRSGYVYRGSFDNTMYSNITPNRQPRRSTRGVRYEGYFSDLTSDIKAYAEAPYANAGGRTYTDKLFDTQQEGNERVGRAFPHETNEYPSVRLEFRSNWDVFEPVDMQPVTVAIPQDKSPSGQAISLDVLPKSVAVAYPGGGAALVTVDAEGLTDGIDGVTVIPPTSNPQIYGPYSSPIDAPLTTPDATYGAQNSDNPYTRSGGILVATQDGHAARFDSSGAAVDLSLTAAQRTALGTGLKLIADPYAYERLIFYGSDATFIMDDSGALYPTWRQVDLSSGAGTGSWSQPFDFSVSDGGFMLSDESATQSPATDGVWTGGTGWVVTAALVGGVGNAMAVDVEFAFHANIEIDVAEMIYDVTKGTFNIPGYNNGILLFLGGVQQTSTLISSDTDPDGTGKTISTSSTVTADSVHIQLRASIYSGAGSDGTGKITSFSLTGPGSINPFTGTPTGGASAETLISDIIGSPNRRGWFAWLSKKTVGGDDYVFVNTTADYFSSIASTLQVAKWVATMTYTLSMSSYNSGSTGVGYVTAGDASGSDAKRYKTTNWFATVSAESALASRGGQINIPYAKTGGASNAGSSPQFVVIKGLNGANLEDIATDGTTNTTITGGSKYGIGPYSLHSFTLDGSYISFVASDGTLRVSSDGGKTWSAGTAAPATGNVYGITGSPTNYQFLLAFGDRGLAGSADRGTTWSDGWSAFDTFRSGAWGTEGKIIISAFADLNLIYSRPITS